MIELNYGSDAAKVRIEFPAQWSPVDISALTLAVNDKDGNELAAAAAATIRDVSTLDADAAAFSKQFVLSDGDPDLVQGDTVLLVGAAGSEKLRVKGYNSTTFTAETTTVLTNGYEAGNSVYGCFAEIELDISDTSVFLSGMEVILIWTPTGTGGPFTQLATVSKFRQMEVSGIETYLEDIYSRAHLGLTQPKSRIKSVLADATRMVRNELQLVDFRFQIELVRDQDLLIPPIAAAMAYIWARGGDDALEGEEKRYRSALTTEINTLCKSNVWVDQNEDTVEDTGETVTHEQIFHNGY